MATRGVASLVAVLVLVACGGRATESGVRSPTAPARAQADAAADASPAASRPAPAEAEPESDADAALERGRELNRAWEFGEAIVQLELALRLYQAEPEPDELDIMDAMSALGRAYRGRGRWKDAEEVLRRRLAIADRNEDPGERASALSDLAQTISEAGDPRAAIPMFEEAIAIDETLGRGDDHDGKMARVHNLGLALGDVGDERGAIRLLERVLVADKKKDPVSVATANTMHNLALNYRDAGELEKAEDLFESAIRIITAKEGGDHPRLVPSLNGLAGTLKLAGKLDEAELLYKQVLSITGDGRLDGRSIALGDLGDLEVQQGRYEEALEHLDESMRLLEQLYPGTKGNAEIVRTFIKRTAAHLGLDHIAEAERDTKAAIAMATIVYAGYEAELASKIDWLADIWEEAGHRRRARSLRAQADRARR